MLEPRGADSSASHEPATDVSARVPSEARNALLQGRITDALALVDGARHDPDLTQDDRVELALTGLLSQLARGNLRGAAPFSRELTALVRVRGPVAARACLGLGEFAAARGQVEQAVSYFESTGEELAAADDHTWLPWRSGLLIEPLSAARDLFRVTGPGYELPIVWKGSTAGVWKRSCCGHVISTRQRMNTGSLAKALLCSRRYTVDSGELVGQPSAVAELLNRGANSQLRDSSGHTALDRAGVSENAEIIQLLERQ